MEGQTVRVSEGDVVQKTAQLATIDTLRADFAALGIESGSVLLVHASLSAIGWVCGGSVAVIAALQSILGDTGTLVMPTFSTDLSEPSTWQNPPVPESWWQTIRETMPPYDPEVTPTRLMGKIAETFRKQRTVLRSAHPQVSFAARGPHADSITANHSLAFGLGEASPLARLYALGASVLLLGVGHDRNSSLHLAEYRADYPTKQLRQEGAPITVAGSRTWATFDDIDWTSSDFDRIGADFRGTDAGKKGVRLGKVGLAACELLPQRDLVDFAAAWMTKNRD